MRAMGYLKSTFGNHQVNVFKISSKEIPGEFSLKYGFLGDTLQFLSHEMGMLE